MDRSKYKKVYSVIEKRRQIRTEEFAKTRRKPIMVLDTINKTVKKYISTVEASKHIGINKPMISYMLKSGSIVNGLEIKYQ